MMLFNFPPVAQNWMPRVGPAGPNDFIVPFGLVGYWTMDAEDINFTAATIADRSLVGNNGTLILLPSTTLANGQVGQSLLFDGVTDQYVSLPNAMLDTQTVGSISAWVNMTAKPASAGAYGIISSASSTLPNNLMVLNLFGNSASDTRLRINTNINADIMFGNTSLQLGWNHVAATSDGSLIRLYVNGALQTLTVSSGTNTGKWWASSVGATMRYDIGNLRRSSGDIFLFKGAIDEVQVYNRLLDPSEILLKYQVGLAGLNAWPVIGELPAAFVVSGGFFSRYYYDMRNMNV